MSGRSGATPAPDGAKRGRKVIVVGAGFAGLACAYELGAAGYEVQVLEARDRVGGRVRTLRDWIPGKMVEAGGELIGSNHPAWLHYAGIFGLTMRPVTDFPEADRPVVIDGRRLDARTEKGLFEDMERVLDALTEQARVVAAEAPWTTPGAAALDHTSLEQWLAAQRVAPLTSRALHIQLEGDNGASLAQQSLLGMLSQIKGGGLEKYWTDSELFRCAQGNDALAAGFARAIGPSRIHLRSAIVQIDIADKAVSAADESGRRWQADHLVLAIPPSVWHRLTITPALPALLSPQMGINYKFLAKLRKETWPPAGPDGLADGSISETWNSVDRQPGPGFCLTGFAGGPQAVRGRRHYATEGQRVFTAALTALFPGFASDFLEGRFIDWPAEPFTMAGYSTAAPGQITGFGQMLYAGLGRLHFAGEHACYAFPGYMEGALQSGMRVAGHILHA